MRSSALNTMGLALTMNSATHPPNELKASNGMRSSALNTVGSWSHARSQQRKGCTVRCAFFDRDLHSRMPLVPTHLSRVFTPLAGSHCKLRPTTEGPRKNPALSWQRMFHDQLWVARAKCAALGLWGCVSLLWSLRKHSTCPPRLLLGRSQHAWDPNARPHGCCFSNQLSPS
jgi:hypothetical protein